MNRKMEKTEGPITFVDLGKDAEGVFVAGSSNRRISELAQHFPSVEDAEMAITEIAAKRPEAVAVDFHLAPELLPASNTGPEPKV
jgi:hypothetical protein